MKAIIPSVVISVALIIGYNYIAGKEPVTQAQFAEAHRKIEQQFDSVKTELRKVYEATQRLEKNQSTIIFEVGDVKQKMNAANGKLDTLKQGQELIYGTMKENAGRNLLDELFK